MNSCLKVFLMALILALMSCAIHKTDEQRAVSDCHNNCWAQYQLCNEYCLNSCGHCNDEAAQSTECRYDHYVQEQEVQGGIIARELNSYRDPLQCLKITCNCSADFTMCTQGCTGPVEKQLRAKPYCN